MKKYGRYLQETITMKLIFDAHLDLAMNALEWNRDLRLPVNKINDLEKNLRQAYRGNATVSFPE